VLRLCQVIRPVPRLCVVIRNKYRVLRGRVVSPPPNPQAGGPPTVGCPRLLIQYIRSYPPHSYKNKSKDKFVLWLFLHTPLYRILMEQFNSHASFRHFHLLCNKTLNLEARSYKKLILYSKNVNESMTWHYTYCSVCCKTIIFSPMVTKLSCSFY
jgi:hypothetical protein